MLTPEDKTSEGILGNVGRVIRAESQIWREMRNRPEPLFDLKPQSPAPAGLGLDANNWRGKITSICSKLSAQGYPMLSDREIIDVANKTLPKPIAACQASIRDILRKKLEPGIARRMIATISESISKLAGRS